VGIDFAAEGLLDGLGGEARAARLELLEQLTAEGVGIEELRAAGRDGRLLYVGAERAMGGEARYSLREVGEILQMYAGWGMRGSFVPYDEVYEEPAIEVRKPKRGR